MATEWKLIKEGESKGATYRPNRAGITKKKYFINLERLYDFCLKNGLYNSQDLAWFNCVLLGFPSDEELTSYEREIVRVVRDKLVEAWELTHHLKYVLAARITMGEERGDVPTLAGLYEHEFYNSLHNIFFFSVPDLGKWKNFLGDLAKQMASLTEEYGLRSPNTDSFKRVTKSFPPKADFLNYGKASNMLLDEASQPPKDFSENLALIVTQSMTRALGITGAWIHRGQGEGELYSILHQQ